MVWQYDKLPVGILIWFKSCSHNHNKGVDFFFIAGKHYSHTGANGLFHYEDDSFPICITDEAGVLHPCYENDYTMTEKKELIFTFLQASKKKAASNECSPPDFIWKYEMQLRTSNDASKIVHGYFKLSSEKKSTMQICKSKVKRDNFDINSCSEN